MNIKSSFLETISWNSKGLVPAIVQCAETQRVLMFAWMSRESLLRTIKEQRTVFWSRSRGELWFKGDTSGSVQQVREIKIDCDNDCLLIKVKQLGTGACHTGRETCFFRILDNDGNDWYEERN